MALLKVQFWRYTAATSTAAIFGGADSGGSVSALAYIPGADSAIAVGREDGNLRFLKVSDRSIIGEVVENEKGGVITAVEYMSYDDDMGSNVDLSDVHKIAVKDGQIRISSHNFVFHS